ncbi:MAG: hypothetical protein PHG67_06205 [Bacteroidales bacterium]|jgi:hypothetical protein|nr:hypothetical protein [Bacteroidales bacterium]
MTIKHDILLDENYDLIINDGDFTLDESLNQNVALLLKSQPGDFKHSPFAGVDAEAYLNDSNPNELFKNIRQNLKSDGIRVMKLKVTDDNLEINAEYV